jgi:hypothetical protein
MKAVKEKMKEAGKDEAEIKAFETGAQAYAKKIVGNFKDYDFYVGESMDPDGMLVFPDILHRDTLLTFLWQGCTHELPRRWVYTVRHHLETWSHRDEGLSICGWKVILCGALPAGY